MSASSKENTVPGNILVSSARSGTNYFLAVFGKCFPEAFVVKEIFRPEGDSLALLEEFLGIGQEQIMAWVKADPLTLWQSILARAEQENRVALAKIFYYHAAPENPLWEHFRDHDKVIHLIRRNAFDVFLSRKVAQQTGKWQQFGTHSQSPEIPPLRLHREELVSFIDSQRAHVEHARRFFAKADFTELFYEDIAESTIACAERIGEILGRNIPANPIAIRLKKQKSKSNAEMVENYDEVREFDTFFI
jgi:LPS sulfotransferase NodH